MALPLDLPSKAIPPEAESVWIDLTVTPSGRDAIALALADLPSTSEVWIMSSVSTPLRRISPCVAEAVARRARIATAPSPRTRAVLLVHEWGVPYADRDNLIAEATARGWRVIDDCAHAFVYGIALAQRGATVACSLPKFFPVQSGGLLLRPLVAESRPEALRDWTTAPAAGITALRSSAAERAARHVANWRRLEVLASAQHLSAVDRLRSDVIPEVFRLRVARQFAAQAIAHQLGIETTPPFYVGWIALPCHADLPADYWLAVERLLSEIARCVAA